MWARAAAGARAEAAGRRAADGLSEEKDDAAVPSELLAPLAPARRAVKHVLERLDPTDAPCSRGWGRRGWRRCWPTTCHAGKGGAVPLKLVDFLGSVQRLAWAKDNVCPWERRTCALRRSTRDRGNVAVGAGAGLPVGLEDLFTWAAGAGTCPSCSGPGITAARGMCGRAMAPLRVGR